MAARDWTHVVDRYQKMRPEREKLGAQFLSGERPYLIYQSYPGNIWKDIRTPEASFLGSMAIVEGSLDVPSDDLPVLEPWFGTGVYASMYGCDYVWREGEAPAVHYRYHKVEEIRDIQTPDWRESEIAQLVLRAIRYFRSKTGDAVPIVLTDTQSASDSATLILDASETLVSCLTEPETMMNFMRGINRLILEFSEAQREAIGGAFIQPGHIMLCNKGFGGISLSDDNLAVVSPAVAKEFNLPLDDEIGRAWGGVAIHSCGKWAHMMRYLKEYCPSCVCVDGPFGPETDPTPNDPEPMRDALKGTGVYCHLKTSGQTEIMLEMVKRALHPDLKLVVHPAWVDRATAERNYAELEGLLSGFYKTGNRCSPTV